ncbi:hypothetical protein [Streptomyces sp. NPDC047976]|uniref:hypothetical protein n=1 Tax=Streptomyces sp. NPDC047976 TaxID=3155746 RepID=UPI003433A64F
MEHDPPLVRDVLPALTAELVRLLEAEGERDLAICAYDLRMHGACGCADDFCQSIRTGTHVPGTPFGPDARGVHLLPDRGMINLDVLHGRIEYVEIIDRPDLRIPPSPAAPARDEG